MSFVIRPLVAGEEQLFTAFDAPDVVGVAVFGRSYSDLVAKNQYRPEWTWVALRDGEVVARAAWWGGPDDSEPGALDWFDFTDPDAGVELLRQAPFTAEYCLMLPAGWRADPVVAAAANARIDAAVAAGMKPLVERYRYTWTPADGLPDRPGRLSFRPEPDDEVIVDVLRRIQEGSLDAHKIADLKRMSPDEAARSELADLQWFPSPREWWRLAYTPDGDLVGITVPSRNHVTPVVGFVGVVPEQRGHGYAYDLLLECTHILVAEGADRVAADTDSTNVPMAANFAKAGYPITQERIFLAY
ncbi:GNAT family N-acetyltransferase [Actinocrispum wychmicini]|uniref:Acetyltransferase (GNAT) family protein n=1 Tax=Actinocrispum wychmicini TaxID=1213861 RepID=A0A4R2KF99_9PSEU|nr:GNAT family N-acetyltransferase [Actinocrispum wychmicini]TCO65205.1 acetyltransferase (GNAT) family protein [Actinocrispum wychmicini]